MLSEMHFKAAQAFLAWIQKSESILVSIYLKSIII